MLSINFNKILERLGMPRNTAVTGTVDFQYDERTGTLTRGDTQTVFRPKTAAVFSLLFTNPDRIVSKAELLEEVWNGVIVQEQAVFQSITEIRQAFNDPKCIRTHPRKGYQWTGGMPQAKFTSKLSKQSIGVIGAGLLLVAVAMWLPNRPAAYGDRPLIAVMPAHQQPNSAARDIGLPNSLADMLNHHITANGIGTALPTAGKPATHGASETNTASLLADAGADILVQMEAKREGTSLSIDYVITNSTHSITGNYTHTSVTWIIHQIAHQLHDATTYSLVGTHDPLKMELHLKKMQAEKLRQQGDFVAATRLFEEIVEQDPNFLSAAFELLAGKWRQDGGTIDIAIAAFVSMAQQQGDSLNEIRAMKLQARRAARANDLDLAIQIAKQGYALAENHHYPYLKASFDVSRGRFETQRGNLHEANALFEEAVTRYQLMECPAGELAVHDMLAQNLAAMGEHDRAAEATQKAEALRTLGY